MSHKVRPNGPWTLKLTIDSVVGVTRGLLVVFLLIAYPRGGGIRKPGITPGFS